jgi:hypothetical protein
MPDEMNKNQQARLVARVFDQMQAATNVLHIYEDGYVLVLDGPSDRHLACREPLLRLCPNLEEARTSSGLSLFLLPAEEVPANPHKCDPHLRAITLKGGYHDHREESVHSLDLVVALAEKLAATMKEAR